MSAGTNLPASNITTSPGTISSESISIVLPSLFTSALGDAIFLSSAIA